MGPEHASGAAILSLSGGFEHACLETFQYQTENNRVYREFIHGLGIDPLSVRTIEKIPFLPVEFFKTHEVIVQGKPVCVTFTSSGTSGTVQSRHFVHDPELYKASFRKAFELNYGDIGEYCFLALLPSYLEREGSSLILMAEDLIKRSGHAHSGFYLHNHQALYETLLKLEEEGQKTILLGVSYALLDFADAFPMQLKYTIVMETGGMKGTRREMVKEELHADLCARLGCLSIHSEYGMTELLSQAYSKGKGIFQCPPWMKILTRDTSDPLSRARAGATGGINIIDLANRYSCSFIATQDLGKVYRDDSFEILGRFDNSDARGCNLMIAG